MAPPCTPSGLYPEDSVTGSEISWSATTPFLIDAAPLGHRRGRSVGDVHLKPEAPDRVATARPVRSGEGCLGRSFGPKEELDRWSGQASAGPQGSSG